MLGRQNDDKAYHFVRRSCRLSSCDCFVLNLTLSDRQAPPNRHIAL